MPTYHKIPVWLAPWILLTSCTSISQPEAFQAVQNEVVAQTGHSVAWNQNTVDDEKAESAVQKILQKPLTANDAVEIAFLKNPDLQASFEEIGISQADLVQAGLLHNPTLMASWRFPDRPPSITDTEYSIAADFLDLVLIPLKTKVAALNLEQTELRIDHEVLRLAGEVKIAFYNLQAQEQLEKRFKLIVKADEAAADLARDQKQAGNTSDLDYSTQQAQLVSSHLYLTNAQKEKIAMRENLNRLMGLGDADLAWQVDPDLPPLPNREISRQNFEEVALTHRRDLAAMQQGVNALGLALSLKTNLRFVPASINVGADTEKMSEGQRITGPTLDLELPIFDQGQGDIPKLAAQYRQAKREWEARVIQVRSEVREMSETLKLNRELVDYYQKTVVPLNIHIVNQSVLQFNAMQKSTFDLFLSKQRELETEKEYIGAWRDYWISRTELEQAVGGRLVPSQT